MVVSFFLSACSNTHTRINGAGGGGLSLKEQDTPVSASSPSHTLEQRVYTMCCITRVCVCVTR